MYIYIYILKRVESDHVEVIFAFPSDISPRFMWGGGGGEKLLYIQDNNISHSHVHGKLEPNSYFSINLS